MPGATKTLHGLRKLLCIVVRSSKAATKDGNPGDTNFMNLHETAKHFNRGERE
jgi:hypothetical protein